MNLTKSNTKRIVAGVVIALAFAVALPAQAALTQSQVDAIISLLQSFGADAATIANVQTSLTGGTPTGDGSTTGYVFSTDLTIGSKGADVTALQQILVSKGYLVMPTGVAYGYFGSLTQSAVAKWQAASGISPAAGYVGPKSRAALNASGGTGGTVVIPPSGATLSVAAATQPSAQLAPTGAARVPFTKFTLTAGAADIVVNSVTVQRVGPGQDAAFAGVVLVDENGAQIGLAKTLNSNHQASIGEPFTVKAGTTRTLTVGGNMGTIGSTYAGEAPAFSVVAINTSSPVVGSLPITGTAQTTNGTLTIGSVSPTYSYDPGDPSKSIGTTNFNFGSVKLTASGEDIRLGSIRWNQSGSASSADLANVMTQVDGVKYPTTLSADGKYYTTTFGSGIIIAKGFSKEISVYADIIGGPGRTVAFDIYRNTDLAISGETYGYGVSPSVTGTTGLFGTANPWFDGSTVTILAGSVTTIGKATEVASTNVAVNVPNQVLGGFATEFTGEPVTISGMSVYFDYSTLTSATANLLTNVTIVDSNGAVVAGPKDATDSTGTTQYVAFTDSVTFPTSRKIYTIKGTIDSDVTNGQTITASTTPSLWTSPTGQNTGNTVTISTTVFTMNAMTVKTADLNVTMSTQPISQNIVAGGQDITFANIQLDASGSGEDVRISQVSLNLGVGGAAAVTDLTGCQLYDGSSVLNTGSNVPTTLDGTDVFSLDGPLTISKGTVKTLALKCDVATAVTGTYKWSIVAGDWTTTANAGTGVSSGSTVDIDATAGDAGTMTVASGSLTTTVDSSSPSYTIVSGGTSGVTAAVIKLLASNEAVNLTKLGLKLTNLASSSSTDLLTVSIFDGATQVGTALFTGVTTVATSTLDIPVSLPKDTEKVLTVKVNVADIGTGQPATEGHLIAIDPDSAEGSGLASGTTIQSGATAGVAGIRIFNTYPTLALDTLESTGIADGRLMRFKVTASSAGPVGLYQFSFNIASTSGVTITNVALYAYTNSTYSSPISGQGTNGQIGDTLANINIGATVNSFEVAAATTAVQVPAGATYYFELNASIAGVDTGDSVVTTLEGDASYPVTPALLTYCSGGSGTGSVACGAGGAGGMAGVSSSTVLGFVSSTTAIDAGTNDDFIWSPNATTSASFTANDWTNGYGVNGLPSSGLIKTRSN